MVETLFDTFIPSEVADQRRLQRAGSSDGEKIALVLQAYPSLSGQENIYQLCRLLVEEAGVSLVTVESDDKQVQLPTTLRNASIKDMMLSHAISGGVLKLVDDRLPGLDVWGVDDLKLITPAHEAMAKLHTIAPDREQIFSRVSKLLQIAQARFYPPAIAELRRVALNIYASDSRAKPSMLDRVALIKQAAELVGMRLDDFPMLAQFHRTVGYEREIDFKSVENERSVLVKHLADQMHDWREQIQNEQEALSVMTTRTFVRHWAKVTRQTEDELAQNIARRGVRDILLECSDWIYSWMVEGAIQARGQTDGGGFFDELLQLAEGLEGTGAELSDFRKYVAYFRSATQEINRDTLLAELNECSLALLDGLDDPLAHMLRELEDQLDALYRALRMGMTAGDAELFDIGPGRLLEAAERLCNHVAVPWQPGDKIRLLDEMLAYAEVFLRTSRERSRYMVARTLELMRERGDDRAVLVIGGFHQRAIVRALEDQRRVSWTVFMPKMDLDADAQDEDLQRRFSQLS